MPGEISMPGEIDEFSFTASAGETIYIRVADTETTEFVDIAFDPFVALIGPSGNVSASGGSSTTGGLVAGISLALVEDGTYSVRVSDDGAFDGANTGSYNIYFAKAPGADDDGVLPNGGSLSGRIDRGDIDSYVFVADAGETVYLRVADTETNEFENSSFSPVVILLLSLIHI